MIRFFKGRYDFSRGSTVATAIMLTVMIGLGVWQIQRLHWKENLLATIDARTHQAPQNVSTLIDEPDADYRPATASGLFQLDHTFYLLALSLTGEGGYHILTPLQLDDAKIVLVDRGWVPYDHKNDYFKPIGPVSVAGILRRPDHHLFDSANDPAKGNWYHIDLDAMAKTAGSGAFLPYVLEADKSPNQGGYPLGGQTRIALPNNHFGYALTWFGLAFILAVVFILSARRKDAAN